MPGCLSGRRRRAGCERKCEHRGSRARWRSRSSARRSADEHEPITGACGQLWQGCQFAAARATDRCPRWRGHSASVRKTTPPAPLRDEAPMRRIWVPCRLHAASDRGDSLTERGLSHQSRLGPVDLSSAPLRSVVASAAVALPKTQKSHVVVVCARFNCEVACVHKSRR